MTGAATGVRVRGLGKRYRRTLPRYHTVLGRLRHAWGGEPQAAGEVWALRDVSFDVGPGECLGVSGPNGAGKSTLLRVVAGILEPTEGEVALRGRTNCLLQLHAGVQPELSVRDNLELGSVLLGLGRREAVRRLDAVLDFAGLAGQAEVRMAELSSGQCARAAFAVAIHADLDVLLVDEALAVGDVPFREKCLDALAGLLRDGKTLLVASHEASQLDRLAGKVLRLRDGRAER